MSNSVSSQIYGIWNVDPIDNVSPRENLIISQLAVLPRQCTSNQATDGLEPRLDSCLANEPRPYVPNPSQEGIDSITSNELPEREPRKSHRKPLEVSRILTEFDGRNISVKQFIREVKDAEIFVNPNDKDFFIRLVKSKVVGNAKAFLQYKSF